MDVIFRRISVRKYQDRPAEEWPQQDRFDESRIHRI
mgnify:CR=1 FL=1